MTSNHKLCPLHFYTKLALLLLMTPSYSQVLPTITIPGSNEDGNIFGNFIQLSVIAGQSILIILSVVAIVGIGWQLISTFLDARDKNDWGKFGITFVIGGILLLFLAGITQLAWSYLDTLRDLI